MSGETEKAPSGWTVDTLKEYVDTRMTAQDKAVDAALASAAKATDKSEEDVKAWRAQSNEWRGAMNDRETKFVMHADLKALDTRLTTVEKFIERGGGRGEGIRLTTSALVTVMTLAVAVIVAAVVVANFAAR